MNRNRIATLTLSLLALASLGACSSMSPGSMTPMAKVVDNNSLPEAVRVPAGQKQTMATVGAGEITYECRAKKDMAGAFEWAFAGPVATLSMDGKAVGKYYGGPTWEANDGSKVTGKQVAVAPGGAGNIALQLVKADPAMGQGAMQGVSYIQRLNTMGGVAPTTVCDAGTAGTRTQVSYRADYVFYRAM